jgi:hypothetical protein
MMILNKKKNKGMNEQTYKGSTKDIMDLVHRARNSAPSRSFSAVCAEDMIEGKSALAGGLHAAAHSAHARNVVLAKLRTALLDTSELESGRARTAGGAGSSLVHERG